MSKTELIEIIKELLGAIDKIAPEGRIFGNCSPLVRTNMYSEDVDLNQYIGKTIKKANQAVQGSLYKASAP